MSVIPCRTQLAGKMTQAAMLAATISMQCRTHLSGKGDPEWLCAADCLLVKCHQASIDSNGQLHRQLCSNTAEGHTETNQHGLPNYACADTCGCSAGNSVGRVQVGSLQTQGGEMPSPGYVHRVCNLGQGDVNAYPSARLCKS
jgi:hypothetical protein